MSRFLTSAMIVAVGAVASTAAAAPRPNVEFRGGLCLTSTTPACDAVGWGEGCYVTFRYNPRLLGANGASTRFSIFVPFFGENYTLPSGNLVGNTFRTVQGVAVGTGAHEFTSQMRLSSQSPASPAVNTPAISLVGTIQDFDSVPNCDVTFKASGVSVPAQFNQ